VSDRSFCLRRITAFGAVASALAFQAACSSSTTSAGAAADFSLCFDVYSSDGTKFGNSCSGAGTACVPFGPDPAHSLSLSIDAFAGKTHGIWQFQVPNGCIGVPDCGFGIVTIDPGTSSQETVATAGPSVLLPMTKFSGRSGAHTIVLELRNSDGSVAFSSRGQRYVASLSIDVCAVTDAGTGPDTGVVEAGVDGSPPEASTDASSDGPVARESGASTDGATSDQSSPPVDAAADAARDATGE
jgi:hypothetical protein